MKIDFVRLALTFGFVATLAVAATCDYRTRRIPNWTVLCLLGLFLPTAFLNVQPVSLASSLYGFAVAFVVTTIFWMARVVGGGDSKLFSVVSLFFGLKYIGLLAIATSVAGGLVALVMILRRPTRALVMLQTRGRGGWGAGVPYGVAIAAGAIVVGWLTGFLGIDSPVEKMDLDFLGHPRN